MTKNWMQSLAQHYEQMRKRYPHDHLMILFDIDGTILDMRYLVLRLLKQYDRQHHTKHFETLTLKDIFVHENNIIPLLDARQIPIAAQEAILSWYHENAWSSAMMLEAHRSFGGVLEVIRWFQLQPQTAVGLNTARPECIRADTLRSLNKLGATYKVEFEDRLLYMKPDDWPDSNPAAKVAGIRYFEYMGYRAFAFIDNEPDNLAGISMVDLDNEILLLHADTIFESKRTRLPQQAVGGNTYTLTELIPEQGLPRHTQFVWAGINDIANLGQFLASEVRWGELDIQLDESGYDLLIPRAFFTQTSLHRDEAWFNFSYILTRLRDRNKGFKLNLNLNKGSVGQVLALIKPYQFNSERLWFKGDIEYLQEHGFRQIAQAYPEAMIECPVDFLAPLVCNVPDKAFDVLKIFQQWGINYFAINWETPNLRQFFDQMDQWGFKVNIYGVPDLEAFLQAILLMPDSLTSTFNFPKWHYYGRAAHPKNGHRLILPQVH